MPTPLRTPQTSGHSSFRVSNLPLWSLKSPPSHGSKIIIFHLSQSKCTVSALFLRGFKGYNGYSDLQNTTKDAEITWRKITMLCTKNNEKSKLLKSECSARWALLIRGPGIRVPSSAPKSHEESQDSSWDFPFSGALHTFAHFLHTGGKAVFFLALSAFCASWRNLSGQSPSILLRKTAPSLKSPTGAFIAALRLQTRIFLPPPRYTVQKRPPHKTLCGGLKI